ncbi:MAG: uroporphyrinogen decarboxylase family protein [Anaerolineae bacterium]
MTETANQSAFERIFSNDCLSKRERVERTLRHEPVDRVALHDQLSYNPGVIALYTGREIEDFDYGVADIGQVIRQTLDMCFRPFAPLGRERTTTEDGFVVQNDNWTQWYVSRPFSDVEGARAWLAGRLEKLKRATFDAGEARRQYRQEMLHLQTLVGETVICDYAGLGLSDTFRAMGLELFSYLYADHPALVSDYLEAVTQREVRRALAVADLELSPVFLIAEDFATKGGTIFSPAFLRRELFPRVKVVAEAWHSRGLEVLYHSDGNYRAAIPELIEAGMDGFYCLEPALGMDVVELKRHWPSMVWAGGVDGVDLMERGTPEQVRAAVRRQILETDALRTGGLFIGSSSEINPPIKPENFRAMVEAVGELRNDLQEAL